MDDFVRLCQTIEAIEQRMLNLERELTRLKDQSREMQRDLKHVEYKARSN